VIYKTWEKKSLAKKQKKSRDLEWANMIHEDMRSRLIRRQNFMKIIDDTSSTSLGHVDTVSSTLPKSSHHEETLYEINHLEKGNEEENGKDIANDENEFELVN